MKLLEGTQHRVADLSGATVVERDDGTGLEFRGAHAAVFGVEALIGGRYVERLAPTAFDSVLADPKLDCRMLWNHEKHLVLARTTNQTLRLSVDAKGLMLDADMAPVSYARDLVVLLGRGDVNQMSFAFQARDERTIDWDETTLRGPQGESMRFPRATIRSVTGLFDVSPVTFPAYQGTDVGLRTDDARIVDILSARHTAIQVVDQRAIKLYEIYLGQGGRA